MAKLIIDERQVIEDFAQQQRDETKAIAERIEREVHEPQTAYRQAVMNHANDLQQNAEEIWKSGISGGTAVKLADLEELRLAAMAAQALEPIANRQAEEMRKRHGTATPNWPSEKLDDAAKEFEALVTQVNECYDTIINSVARIRYMQKHGLASKVHPDIARYTNNDWRFYSKQLAPVGGDDVNEASRRTPWKAIKQV